MKINLSNFEGSAEGKVMLAAVSEESIAKNGNPYITLTLMDGMTKADVNLFMKRDDFKIAPKTVLDVKLTKNNGFINIQSYSATEDDYKEYVASAPEDSEVLFANVIKTLTVLKERTYGAETENNTLYDLAITVLSTYKDRILYYPASDKYHHMYVGGMIFYIYKMVQDAYNLSRGMHKIDVEVVVAAVCLCELGKLYALKADELGGAERSLWGIIRNDVETSCDIIESIAKKGSYNKNKLAALYIAVRASRGRRAWGSTIEQVTEESFFVATIATLNAKADIYESVKATLEKGQMSEINDKLGIRVLNI